MLKTNSMENFVVPHKEHSADLSEKTSVSMDILTGDDVFKKILGEGFVEEWELLYQSCPWATVYQSFDFIHQWYKHYQQLYLPVLVLSTRNGKLNGLFPLCLGEAKSLQAAGLSQAEYQVWLSAVPDGTGFIQSALHHLVKKFPGHDLQLKYLPHHTPLEWTKKNGFWRKSIWVQPCEQPIMKISRENLEAELRKKNKREKINRLKRLGELKFERITDYTHFSNIYDELAYQNDFRKSAVYNARLQDSSLNKAFLLALFKHHLLHATVLRIGDEIIASNVGTIGDKWLHLQGLNSHSPAHSKHSPGILHFLMLGKLMAEEGFEVFDLTPGADGYKNALATDHITAHKFYFASPSSIHVRKLKFLLWQKCKSCLLSLGVSNQRQRYFKNNLSLAVEKVKMVKTNGLSLLWDHIHSKWHKQKAQKNYMIPSGNGTSYSTSLTIQKNSLRDLLDFEAGHSLLTKKEFLEDAMTKIESRHDFYTLSKSPKLLCCVWLEKHPSKRPQDLIGLDIVRLKDLYIHPLGEKMVREFLIGVAAAIRKEEDQQPYAVLHADKRKIIQLLDKSGFRPASTK